jgi:hypothetical protein
MLLIDELVYRELFEVILFLNRTIIFVQKKNIGWWTLENKTFFFLELRTDKKYNETSFLG